MLRKIARYARIRADAPSKGVEDGGDTMSQVTYWPTWSGCSCASARLSPVAQVRILVGLFDLSLLNQSRTWVPTTSLPDLAASSHLAWSSQIVPRAWPWMFVTGTHRRQWGPGKATVQSATRMSRSSRSRRWSTLADLLPPDTGACPGEPAARKAWLQAREVPGEVLLQSRRLPLLAEIVIKIAQGVR